MTETTQCTQMHDTDVLILGAGASGCGAALATAGKGRRVLLADKGKLESCGSLGGGNDHFMAILNTGAPGDDLETAINFYCTPMSGYTPGHIRQWLEVMPKMIAMLKSLGIVFKYNEDGSFYRTTGFGQPGSWWTHINNGKYIKRRLGRLVRAQGVDTLEYFQCTRLLVENGRIVGAAGFNVRDGSFHVVRARTVVLALGRLAGRVSDNSSHNPFNIAFSPFVTGSQIALAYEAGAEILTLDSEQEATLIPKGWGCPGMNGITSSGARAMNGLDERYMAKYHPMMEIGPRCLLVRGTAQEQSEGNGPPFDLEFRHIDKDILYHLQHDSMPGDKETWNDYCAQADIDFRCKPMEVELSEIYVNGILYVKENFEARTVRGLFSGSMFHDFSGSICSGYLAGQHALEACDHYEPADISPELVEAERARVFAPLQQEEGVGIREDKYEAAIRQVMNYYMGFVRSGRGMERAAAKLDYIASRKGEVIARNLHELMRAHEAMHLLTTCQLTVLATLERKETRFVYKRSDYPDQDPTYDNRLLIVSACEGKPRCTWQIFPNA